MYGDRNGAMMQWAAEAETCNYPIYKCEGVCYKRGKCNACCKQLGFLGGKCNLLRGMLCLCCHEDDDQPPPSSTHLALGHDPLHQRHRGVGAGVEELGAERDDLRVRQRPVAFLGHSQLEEGVHVAGWVVAVSGSGAPGVDQRDVDLVHPPANGHVSGPPVSSKQKKQVALVGCETVYRAQVAGPNAVLIAPNRKNATLLLQKLLYYFPPQDNDLSRCITPVKNISPLGSYRFVHDGGAVTAHHINAGEQQEPVVLVFYAGDAEEWMN
uniref:Diphosphomevalonate decarboxylase n=1 Tax=Oryza punctata TaxID=4537 RepID=A0A0E0JUH7_ORYPU